VVSEPILEELEAIGGTGDSLTGIVSALIDSGIVPDEACVLGSKINRIAGKLSCPDPSTQIYEIIQKIPDAFISLIKLRGDVNRPGFLSGNFHLTTQYVYDTLMHEIQKSDNNFYTAFSTFVYAEKLHFIPRTVIVLPETSLVKIKWILVPGDKDRPPDVSSENIQFVVDYKNNLLFSPYSQVSILKGLFCFHQ